ncbi:MAG TPA: 30S ribosomal protein S6 [Bacteroidia bacterium]|nr:30S ribosomal protein S6 [Bacteroidia bacterium]
MKRKYEGVYILKLQGQESTIDEIVGKITKELEGNGAVLEQIDRLGRKEFVYPNNQKQSHGYYVQYRFEAEPTAIAEVETHLKLNEQVMLQHYRRL